MQIRDLNSGTFGFVQLARDKQTGELIACKFIERGEKVRSRCRHATFDPISTIERRRRDAVICHAWWFHALLLHGASPVMCCIIRVAQVTKYVERDTQPQMFSASAHRAVQGGEHCMERCSTAAAGTNGSAITSAHFLMELHLQTCQQSHHTQFVLSKSGLKGAMH